MTGALRLDARVVGLVVRLATAILDRHRPNESSTNISHTSFFILILTQSTMIRPHLVYQKLSGPLKNSSNCSLNFTQKLLLLFYITVTFYLAGESYCNKKHIWSLPHFTQHEKGSSVFYTVT